MGVARLMKYGVGDRVKIKTWESLEKEFGLNSSEGINTEIPFVISMEEYLNKNFPDKILTINEVKEEYYLIKKNELYFVVR